MASYHKLVRDKIPDIIKNNGEKPIIRILNEKEYKEELEKRLQEELNEVLLAQGQDRLEELADLLEVLINLAKIEDSSFAEIKKIALEKRKKRGSFKKKIYLEDVKTK